MTKRKGPREGQERRLNTRQAQLCSVIVIAPKSPLSCVNNKSITRYGSHVGVRAIWYIVIIAFLHSFIYYSTILQDYNITRPFLLNNLRMTTRLWATYFSFTTIFIPIELLA